MAEELEDTGEVLEVAETTEVIAVGTAEPSAITPVVSDHSGPKEIDPALEENINPTEEDPALEPDHTLEATEPTTALEDSQNTEVPRLSQLTGEERRSMFKILRKERLKDKWNKRFMVDDGDKLELRAENPEDEQIDGSEGEQEAMEHTHDSNDTGSSNEDIEIDTLRNSLDIPPMDAYPSFVEDDSDANATRKFPLEWETSVDDPLSGMALRPPTEPDSIQLKSDFLVDFELPSLSDISDEHSEEELPTVKSVHSVNETKGYFVDPLGGEEASSSSASVTSESTHMYLDQEEHSQQMDADSQSGLSEMSDIPEFADASPEPEPEPRGRALTFDDFSAALKEVVVVEVSEDTDEEMSRIQEIEKTVQDFIEDLLRDLEGSKYRSADRELRNKCDNYKLMRELLNLTDAYIIEKAENALLNTRLCEFYKRVRNTRVFRTLNLLDEGRYYYRYMNGLSRVDYLKQMLQSAKEMYARQMLLLVFDLQSAQTLVNCTEEHLEQTVRKTLLRPGRDFLGRVIERELRLMTSKRRDISDTRLYLITRKHTLGHIMKKITELNTVSETISIKDFISIQNDVVTLEKKIEERNIDLKRIRSQYLTDIHLMQHNREKVLELEERLQINKITLWKAMERQHQLRAEHYNAKVDRQNMLKRRRELTIQGGILAMPALLRDYDDTVLKLKAKKEVVAKLKESIRSIGLRISFYEGF